MAERSAGSCDAAETVAKFRLNDRRLAVTGTSVGSTFDDVRRALVRTLDTSGSLDASCAAAADGGRRSTVSGAEKDLVPGAVAAFPADEDRQMLRDLHASVANRQRPSPTSPTAEPPPPPVVLVPPPLQQQQQRVEVRRIRRQTSTTSSTSVTDAPEPVQPPQPPSSSTSTGRLNAVEHFRRNEAKRASVVSHTSSLVSSDGTINVVTDSEDEDDHRPVTAVAAVTQSRQPASPTTPTDNGVPATSPIVAHPTSNQRRSSQSPRRDVTSVSGASSQRSKCRARASSVGHAASVHVTLSSIIHYLLCMLSAF